MGHENKCRNFHGHNYVMIVTARPKRSLDPLGRVIDFSVLKEKLGTWIDLNWDHGFIYSHEDSSAKKVLAEFTKLERQGPAYADSQFGQKVYVLPSNPTAENMADYFLTTIAPKLLSDTSVEVVEVELWETENCFATAKLPS